MKNIKYFTLKSDYFGVLTSLLCLLHCVITPLIFISYSSLNSEFSTSFSWWKNLDYVFIFISFFMVYFSTRISKIKIIKYLFWLSWIFLFLVIINEKINSFQFSEYLTYLAASILSLMHLYNLKYCKWLFKTSSNCAKKIFEILEDDFVQAIFEQLIRFKSCEYSQ